MRQYKYLINGSTYIIYAVNEEQALIKRKLYFNL